MPKELSTGNSVVFVSMRTGARKKCEQIATERNGRFFLLARSFHFINSNLPNVFVMFCAYVATAFPKTTLNWT